jgi:hypothetical protein
LVGFNLKSMEKRKAHRPNLTIRQWLERLPEPYRSKAINNSTEKTLNSNPHYSSPGIRGALFSAFEFSKSPEGADYWGDYYDSL